MDLVKVRTSGFRSVAMSMYVNDTEMLHSVSQDSVSAIAKLLQDVESLSTEYVFYKVQDRAGAPVGFFMASTDPSDKNIPVFYVRPLCRTEEYFRAFFGLVSQTVYGEVYGSVSPGDMDNINAVLKDNFTILGPYLPYGKILI